jgi:hypothetical protein
MITSLLDSYVQKPANALGLLSPLHSFIFVMPSHHGRLGRRHVATRVKIPIIWIRGLLFLCFLISLCLSWIPRLADPDNASKVDKADVAHVFNHSDIPSLNQGNVVTIAYVISVVKCSDFQSSTAGLRDAALVLRHSVHSIHQEDQSFPYSFRYQMYALVHEQVAQDCHDAVVLPLKLAGYRIRIRPTPVTLADLSSEYLRQNVHKEWCCGMDEFIKLYAHDPHTFHYDDRMDEDSGHLYETPTIVVHTDIDFVFVKPMSDLFQVMLLPVHDPQRVRLLQSIPQETRDSHEHTKEATTSIGSSASTATRPNNTEQFGVIDTFLTRDWGQVIPGRKAGYQAGFLITRPDAAVFRHMLQVLKTSTYVDGTNRSNGWGGLGYGSFVGAMAMQGFMAYYYDVYRPTATWVELNPCRFNHMGMDVRYNGPPAFLGPRHPKVGHCRNNRDDCEDCQRTSLKRIYNIHYTQCRKPWNCIGYGSSSIPLEHQQISHAKKHRITADAKLWRQVSKSAIPEESVLLDHCLSLQSIWHAYRHDLESQWYELTGDESVRAGGGSTESKLSPYMPHIFRNHCHHRELISPLNSSKVIGQGKTAVYKPLTATAASWRRLRELYP